MYQTTIQQPDPVDISIPLVPAHHKFLTSRDTGREPTRKLPLNSFLEGDGLQTPPPEDMSNIYPHQPHYSLCDNRLATTSYAAPVSIQPFRGGQSRFSNDVNLPPLDASLNYRGEVPRLQNRQFWEQYQNPTMNDETSTTKKVVDIKNTSTTGKSATCRTKLQIPSTISSNGGSLSDLAAMITCLFWFESIETLNEAEGLAMSASPRPLKPEAMPSSAFKKWVSTILSTTQVTDNVIILALLFIYRLKKYNSFVKGRSGSEYRLLTVALMLGNKFLDDNTYTNNTWAEVSGISVKEIHMMEVEFLSNMRYSLVASKEQWDEWHRKLRMFKQYCETSKRVSRVSYSLPPMPSPPGSTRASPPPIKNSIGYAHSESNCRPWPLFNQVPTDTKSTTTNQAHPPNLSRKRSIVEEVEDSMSRKMTGSNVRKKNNAATYVIPHVARPDLSRRQPSLPINQHGITTMNLGCSGSINLVLPSLGPLPLTSTRTSTAVFPSNARKSTTPTWAPQFPFPTKNGSSLHPNMSQPAASPQGHFSLQELLTYSASSPVSASQPGHYSPSVFLQQRSSPYKPVCHVNTLLYPPPFSSIQENSIDAEEMRYRPIGKRNENIRTGVVPHWPANWQSHPHE